MSSACRLRPLQDDRVAGLVRGFLDRPVEQRLVGDHLRALDAARCRDDQDGLGIVDPGRELVGGEAAEHDRVDRADARAGEHGHQRFGDHGHVDNHTVAVAHAMADHHPGEAGDHALQLGVGDRALAAGDGAVVDDRRLAATAGSNVPVDRVVAGVEPTTLEPAIEGGVRVVEHAVPGAVPMQGGRRIRPELAGILQAALVDAAIDVHGLATSPAVAIPDDRHRGVRSQRGEMTGRERRLPPPSGSPKLRRSGSVEGRWNPPSSASSGSTASVSSW